MKKLTRIFSFCLAVLMLLLPLVACDSESPETPGDTTGATGTEIPGGTDEPTVTVPLGYIPTYDVIKEADDALVDELWANTQAKIDAIMSTESTIQPAEGGKVYYVSALNGNDKNDGLTPETAWKTLDRVTVKQRKTIVAGDVVAFERGGIYYNITQDNFKAKSGVSYTAYGEGDKPIITAAMGDVADPSYWKQMEENPNVWYTNKFVDQFSVGNIVFNHGESMGEVFVREYIGGTIDGALGDLTSGLPYGGPESFTRDGQYEYKYSGSGSNGTVYLYCSKGNPGEVYDSIHFSRCLSSIDARGTENVVIDNLSVRYAGEIGIVANDTKNFTVQNCEVAYIGGSYRQNEVWDGVHYRRWDTRMGNGIEAYGSADGYYIIGNYAHDILDEAFTTQNSDGSNPVMRDLHYTDNVTVRCGATVSLWGGSGVEVMEFARNDCWYAGMGPLAGNRHIYGEGGGAVVISTKLGEEETFIFKDNVIAFAGAFLVRFQPCYEENDIGGNIYLGEDSNYFGMDTNAVIYNWDDQVVDAIRELMYDDTSVAYVKRTAYYTTERTQPTMTIPADVKVGDVVTFGAYEQDNDAANGAEEIEWIVLDVKDGKALLLSKYVLDACYIYPSEPGYQFLRWELCSIRNFFEGTFLKRAFTDEEVAKMGTVTVGFEPNPTYDDYHEDEGSISRLFILSADELISYLGEDGLKAAGTEYALNREGYGMNIPTLNGGASYWTRNFGNGYKAVGVINFDGEWDQYGSFWWTSCTKGVRPAVWVEVG